MHFLVYIICSKIKLEPSSKVTKCKLEGPNCVLPTELAGMPEPPNRQPDSGQKAKKTKELTDSMRKWIVVTTMQQCKDGVPPHGVFQKISQMVGVHQLTVMRPRKNLGTNVSQALSTLAIKFSHNGNRGRQHTYIPGRSMIEHVQSIPVSQRRTIQDLSGILDVSLGTTHCLVKEGDVLCKHSLMMRPTLSARHRWKRKYYF